MWDHLFKDRLFKHCNASVEIALSFPRQESHRFRKVSMESSEYI